MDIAWWQVVLNVLGFLLCCLIGAKIWRAVIRAFHDDDSQE